MFGPVGVEAIELIERSVTAEEIASHFSEKTTTMIETLLLFCSVFFGRERIYNGLVSTL